MAPPAPTRRPCEDRAPRAPAAGGRPALDAPRPSGRLPGAVKPPRARLAAALAGGALLVLGGGASAATFTITSANDSGVGTLRAAIDLANQAPDEVGAETHRVADPPRYFQRVEIQFQAAGQVPRERLERAIRLSRDKYCSVFHTLRPDLQFEWSALLDESRRGEERP